MRDADERTGGSESLAVGQHFARVASDYRSLRQTDTPPVFQIEAGLPDGRLTGVDVGAGTGRYTELMESVLGPRASIHAVDLSQAMLQEQFHHGRQRLVCSEAEQLPFADDSIDFVTTFNAVHHFDLDKFVPEVARVLTAEGDLFVYTRTPEQNALSIWGRAFPDFASRENRLHNQATLRRSLECLGNVTMTTFSFDRRATPATLIQRVKGGAYSTFALYEPDELDQALHRFLQAIVPDTGDDVTWQDHNTLVHVDRHD